MNCKNIRKTVIFLVLLAFLTAHIYFVVLKYLEFQTYSSSQSELQWPIQLPDVTICTNDVDSKYEKNWKRKEELKTIRYNSYTKGRPAPNNEYTPFHIAKYCFYTDYGIPCKAQHHHNYFYGNCETISQGENRLEFPITGIEFGGDSELANHYKFHRQPVFFMVLHKPKTEPVFLKSNIIPIDLFSDVSVSLRKRVINRQRDCIQEEGMKNKVVLNFANRNQYSYEVCLTLCFQNYSLTQHKCILPQFYFKENENRDEMCTGVHGEFSLDLEKLCDCKPLCEDYQFEIEVKNVELRDEEKALEYQILPFFSFRAQQKSGGGMGGDEGFGEDEEENRWWNFEGDSEFIPSRTDDEGYRGFGKGGNENSLTGGSFGGGGGIVDGEQNHGRNDDFGEGGRRDSGLVDDEGFEESEQRLSRNEVLGRGGGFGGGKEFQDGELRRKRWVPRRDDPQFFSTWTVKIQFESAHVTVTQEKLENDEFILLGTIGGVLCFWLGTSVPATLKLTFFLIKSGANKIIWTLTQFRKKKLQSMFFILLNLMRLTFAIVLMIATGFSSNYLIQNNYSKLTEYEHPSIEFTQTQFPSVTVCSSVPIVWINRKFADFTENQFNIKWDNLPIINSGMLGEEVTEEIVKAVPLYSLEERTGFGLKIEEFIRKCQLSFKGIKRNCSMDHFVQFNNQKFGNCATFNHGSLSAEDVEEPIDELEMFLSWNQLPLSRGFPVSDLPGLMVHIHPKGTSPLFTPKTTHIVRQFSMLHLAYKSMTHHNWKCKSENDAEMRAKNIYQDEKRQYKHNFHSCMESCFQNISYADRECNVCYMPAMFGQRSAKGKNTCTSFCPFIEPEELINNCGCKQSCNENAYSVQTFVTKFRVKSENSYNQIEIRHNKEYPMYQNAPPFINITRKLFPDGNCGLKVYPLSNSKKKYFNSPKIKLPSLVALISGIICLLQPAFLVIQWTEFFI